MTSDNGSPPPDDVESTTTSNSRGKILRWAVVGVICVALGSGGYLFGKSTAHAEAEEGPPTTILVDADGRPVDSHDWEPVACDSDLKPPALAFIVDLPAMHVNLADGHYLRVAVSLGISEETEIKDPEDFIVAPALDAVVMTLSGRSMNELQTDDGRQAAVDELTEQISARYGPEVLSVYLTEFVMQ